MSKPHPGGADHLGEAQTLVDELSDALGRSVDVDNAHLELVCASAQVGPIDTIRVQAIIDRAPPPKPLPWVLGHGIATAAGPVRLPRNDEFGMLPRVCLPIRHGGGLVGYLWLIDEPPVTVAELAAAARAAALLAPLLGADDAALRERADERQRLVLRVVSGSAAAVEEAVSRGHLAERGSFTTVSAVLADTAEDLLASLARRQLGRPFLAGS